MVVLKSLGLFKNSNVLRHFFDMIAQKRPFARELRQDARQKRLRWRTKLIKAAINVGLCFLQLRKITACGSFSLLVKGECFVTARKQGIVFCRNLGFANIKCVRSFGSFVPPPFDVWSVVLLDWHSGVGQG